MNIQKDRANLDLRIDQSLIRAEKLEMLTSTKFVRPDLFVITGDKILHEQINNAWAEYYALVDESKNPY